MDNKKWEAWPGPWFGYTVARREFDDGLCSGFRYSRNLLGMHRFFFTEAGAQAFADKLNRSESP